MRRGGECQLGIVEGGFLDYPNACAVRTTGELVEDASLRLNFRRTGRDRFKLEGGLALPRRFDAAGQSASCDLGGAQLDFTLDARGRGKSAQGRFKLRFDRRGGTWNYVCKGRRGDWTDDWVDDGLVDADVEDVPAAIPLRVGFGGFVRSGLAPVGYSAKAGRNGKADR